MCTDICLLCYTVTIVAFEVPQELQPLNVFIRQVHLKSWSQKSHEKIFTYYFNEMTFCKDIPLRYVQVFLGMHFLGGATSLPSILLQKVEKDNSPSNFGRKKKCLLWQCFSFIKYLCLWMDHVLLSRNKLVKKIIVVFILIQ